MNFIEKVKGLLLEPSRTFDALKEESLIEAIKFYAVFAMIFSALFAIFFGFMGFTGSMMGFGNLGPLMGAGAGLGIAIGIFVLVMVIAIAGSFISSVIIHIFVYMLGGKKGIVQTIKAVMYGSSVSLLLGWIPLLNMIAGIWSILIEIIGIRQLQEITIERSILAVVLPIILSIILAIIMAATIAAFLIDFSGIQL